MITTVLAIFTLSAVLGEAPPQIISTHKTYAECQNARRQPRWGRLARQKLLHELWEEMQIKDVDGKKGIVTGYFSDFNSIDSDGDIIKPGAFQKSISHYGALYPFCWVRLRRALLICLRVNTVNFYTVRQTR